MDRARARCTAGCLLVAWGCTSFGAAFAETPRSAAVAAVGAPLDSVSASIVDLTNVERDRAGIAPLRTNQQLMRAAQLQAEQMASIGRLDHVLNGGPYPSPKDRLAAAGYRWQAYGENIAYGQTGPEAVTDGWMHSAGHRINVLNAAYTELGTGYAVDRDGRPYFVQVFGRPVS